MKKSATILLLILAVSVTWVNSQEVEFYREDIKFELKEGYFKVDGDYFFRNPDLNPVRTELVYPFPLDTIYGIVDSIFAIDIIDRKDNLKQVTNKAAAIELFILPFDTTVINIGYRQELKSYRAEYILTTTRGWGKAFEEVYYTLISQSNITIDGFSYEPDTNYTNSGKNIYTWKKKNFLPEINFIIDYHVE